MLDDYGGELLHFCDGAGRRAHTVLIPKRCIRLRSYFDPRLRIYSWQAIAMRVSWKSAIHTRGEITALMQYSAGLIREADKEPLILGPFSAREQERIGRTR
jgi:hypothetical protein